MGSTNFAANAINNNSFILGVDVGGTAIKPKLYEVKNDILVGDGLSLFSEEEIGNKLNQTRRGFSNHKSQMKDIFSRAAGLVQQHDGTIAAICLGTPGRYKPNGTITENTATQLDLMDDHMYGKVMEREYRDALPVYVKNTNLPIEVGNDANWMILGMLTSLEKGEASAVDQDNQPILGKRKFAPRYIGMFGLGTGIGHSIVKIDVNGTQEIVTDGHASKLVTKVDQEDMELFKKAEKIMDDLNKKKGYANERSVHWKEGVDDLVRAEDLFKGPTFDAIASIGNTEHERRTSKEIAAAFVGKYMARTIEAIASGINQDINYPNQGWSDLDKAIAAKTDTYLIGGGLGKGYIDPETGKKDEKRSEAGKKIIEYAIKELNKRSDTLDKEGQNELSAKLRSIRIAQFVGPEVAEKAAAEVALKALLSRAKSA